MIIPTCRRSRTVRVVALMMVIVVVVIIMIVIVTVIVVIIIIIIKTVSVLFLVVVGYEVTKRRVGKTIVEGSRGRCSCVRRRRQARDRARRRRRCRRGYRVLVWRRVFKLCLIRAAGCTIPW